jgi:histidine triad (HIT) family protein
MSTIFEKIIAREIPAEIIYEDEQTLAFLDIKPNNKGHALVIPKVVSKNIFEIDDDAFSAMARTAIKVARAIKSATGCDGINIIMNNEGAAGQEVFHAHLHVIPRFQGDNVFGQITHVSYDEGEMETYAERIRTLISKPYAKGEI